MKFHHPQTVISMLFFGICVFHVGYANAAYCEGTYPIVNNFFSEPPSIAPHTSTTLTLDVSLGGSYNCYDSFSGFGV